MVAPQDGEPEVDGIARETIASPLGDVGVLGIVGLGDADERSEESREKSKDM